MGPDSKGTKGGAHCRYLTTIGTMGPWTKKGHTSNFDIMQHLVDLKSSDLIS